MHWKTFSLFSSSPLYLLCCRTLWLTAMQSIKHFFSCIHYRYNRIFDRRPFHLFFCGTLESINSNNHYNNRPPCELISSTLDLTTTTHELNTALGWVVHTHSICIVGTNISLNVLWGHHKKHCILLDTRIKLRWWWLYTRVAVGVYNL